MVYSTKIGGTYHEPYFEFRIGSSVASGRNEIISEIGVCFEVD